MAMMVRRLLLAGRHNNVISGVAKPGYVLPGRHGIYLRFPSDVAAKGIMGMVERWKCSFVRNAFRSIVIPIRNHHVVQRQLTLRFFGSGRWQLSRSNSNPWRQMSRLFNYSDSSFWIIFGINLTVFLLWQVADPNFMRANFTISVYNVAAGRIHTLLTSAFSHHDMLHFGINMLGLYFFGLEVLHRFGSKTFFLLYIAGGLGGSVGHIIYEQYILPRLKGVSWHRMSMSSTVPALGASGAVNAMVVLSILLYPRRIIYVNFFLPVPAALFGVYLITKDLLGASNVESTVGHMGHLGGALVGALAWQRLRWRW